jgi:hypothetical protein
MIIPINIRQEEIERRKTLLQQWSEFRNERPPVHIFADSPFYCKLAGINLDVLYKDPEVMVRAQLLGWKVILEKVDCDIAAPPVFIDFGSCLTGTMYGCKLLEQPGSVPTTRPWFESENDLKILAKIDPFATGLHTKYVDYYHHLHKMSRDYAIQFDGGEPSYPLENIMLFLGSEGPFTIACEIAGFDRLSLWCYDNPALVKKILRLITEKEIERIRKSFQMMGKPACDVFLADDFAPYVSVDIYKEFDLPYQRKLIEAFGNRCIFHCCVPDKKLLKFWKEEVKCQLFNGFKPQGGLKNLIKDYKPVMDLMAGSVLIEPDWDGANIMIADEMDLKKATADYLSLFNDFRGVKVGFTFTGGLRPDDIKKANIVKQTVLAG